MAIDASLLNTQYYKARIKGKAVQSRERISVLSVLAIEKGSLRVVLDDGLQLYFHFYIYT